MTASQNLLNKYENTIKDNFAIVAGVTIGLGIHAFWDLVTVSGLNKKELAESIVGIRLETIQEYEEEEKKLNPRDSEMVLKMLALYKKGIEIFGEIDSFNRWLLKPAFGLGNQIPYKLLNTVTGIDLIFEELTRIEYGDLA